MEKTAEGTVRGGGQKERRMGRRSVSRSVEETEVGWRSASQTERRMRREVALAWAREENGGSEVEDD